MNLHLHHARPAWSVLQRSATSPWTSRIWFTSRYCSISTDTTTSTSTSANAARHCGSATANSNAVVCPREWTHLGTPAQRRQEEAVHQMVQEEAQDQEQVTSRDGSTPPVPPPPTPGSTPPQQSGGAGNPGGTPPTTPPATPPSSRSIDPWASLDRSRKSLPKLSLPSNRKSCSILDMQQTLEVWYDKSTFAIATWRGDAQRYWLAQVLDLARARHDQGVQSYSRTCIYLGWLETCP